MKNRHCIVLFHWDFNTGLVPKKYYQSSLIINVNVLTNWKSNARMMCNVTYIDGCVMCSARPVCFPVGTVTKKDFSMLKDMYSSHCNLALCKVETKTLRDTNQKETCKRVLSLWLLCRQRRDEVNSSALKANSVLICKQDLYNFILN